MPHFLASEGSKTKYLIVKGILTYIEFETLMYFLIFSFIEFYRHMLLQYNNQNLPGSSES